MKNINFWANKDFLKTCVKIVYCRKSV